MTVPDQNLQAALYVVFGGGGLLLAMWGAWRGLSSVIDERAGAVEDRLGKRADRQDTAMNDLYTRVNSLPDTYQRRDEARDEAKRLEAQIEAVGARVDRGFENITHRLDRLLDGRNLPTGGD